MPKKSAKIERGAARVRGAGAARARAIRAYPVRREKIAGPRAHKPVGAEADRSIGPSVDRGRLEALHAWYRAEARDLPWRRTRDPYRILVSEFLLQQTQVKQAIPYYERFLARFPTLADLAEASEDAVLKAWEGCGYYARARNLRKTARIIQSQYGGNVPREREALLELPGIGPYLAASISSIAYERPNAVLDGNVIRVLARAGAYPKVVDTPAAKRELQARAQGWLEAGYAGARGAAPSVHNQAMMELGARICTPQNPKCAACPLASSCQAHRLGREEDFPIRGRRAARPLIPVATGLLLRGEEVLISQRYGDDFLGGLWEFPGGKQDAGETLEETVAREFKEEVGLDVRAVRALMVVRAEYTHKSVDMHVFLCAMSGSGTQRPRPLDCQDVRWERIDRLRRYAFPRANHQMIEWLEKNPHTRR